jgi:hypothetical protein
LPETHGIEIVSETSLMRMLESTASTCDLAIVAILSDLDSGQPQCLREGEETILCATCRGASCQARRPNVPAR